MIRAGDTIRIVTPNVFVRCGYPMDVKEESTKIRDAHKTSIYKLVEVVCGAGDTSEKLGTFSLSLTSTRVIEKICNALAYEKCNRHKFGGRHRQIFTRHDPDLAGKEGRVLSIRTVKTGKYYPPNYYQDLDGGDYKPGGLTDQKSHRILEVWIPSQPLQIEIEVKNVGKVENE